MWPSWMRLVTYRGILFAVGGGIEQSRCKLSNHLRRIRTSVRSWARHLELPPTPALGPQRGAMHYRNQVRDPTRAGAPTRDAPRPRLGSGPRSPLQSQRGDQRRIRLVLADVR